MHSWVYDDGDRGEWVHIGDSVEIEVDEQGNRAIGVISGASGRGRPVVLVRGTGAQYEVHTLSIKRRIT